MGQKANPNIFRLGKVKKWQSKYVEKRSTELSSYVFRDLEIQKFTFKFLAKHGIAVQNCKLLYTNDIIHVYISYFITPQTTALVNEINKNQRLRVLHIKKNIREKRKSKKKCHVIRFKARKHTISGVLLHNIKIRVFLGKNNFQRTKEAKNQTSSILKFNRLQFLQVYKQSLLAEKLHNTRKIERKEFIGRFLETVSLFTRKKLKVSVTFSRLHQDKKQTISPQKLQLVKKNLLQLQKYKKSFFFTEGINLMLVASLKGKFADILAQFIAVSLKKLTRHNFFFRFIQTALALFIKKSSLSNSVGVKIKIKGRFNGTPRAKHKLMCFGNGTSLLALNSSVDYSERTAFTSCGTFGVKVWVVER